LHQKNHRNCVKISTSAALRKTSLVQQDKVSDSWLESGICSGSVIFVGSGTHVMKKHIENSKAIALVVPALGFAVVLRPACH